MGELTPALLDALRRRADDPRSFIDMPELSEFRRFPPATHAQIDRARGNSGFPSPQSSAPSMSRSRTVVSDRATGSSAWTPARPTTAAPTRRFRTGGGSRVHCLLLLGLPGLFVRHAGRVGRTARRLRMGTRDGADHGLVGSMGLRSSRSVVTPGRRPVGAAGHHATLHSQASPNHDHFKSSWTPTTPARGHEIPGR
jgi:hypothetical protein